MSSAPARSSSICGADKPTGLPFIPHPPPPRLRRRTDGNPPCDGLAVSWDAFYARLVLHTGFVWFSGRRTSTYPITAPSSYKRRTVATIRRRTESARAQQVAGTHQPPRPFADDVDRAGAVPPLRRVHPNSFAGVDVVELGARSGQTVDPHASWYRNVVDTAHSRFRQAGALAPFEQRAAASRGCARRSLRDGRRPRQPVGCRWSRFACIQFLHVLGVEVHVGRASAPELRASCWMELPRALPSLLVACETRLEHLSHAGSDDSRSSRRRHCPVESGTDDGN